MFTTLVIMLSFCGDPGGRQQICNDYVRVTWESGLPAGATLTSKLKLYTRRPETGTWSSNWITLGQFTPPRHVTFNRSSRTGTARVWVQLYDQNLQLIGRSPEYTVSNCSGRAIRPQFPQDRYTIIDLRTCDPNYTPPVVIPAEK